jgi:ADP-ribose pyrophosphatase YjhB (NUDIX family)
MASRTRLAAYAFAVDEGRLLLCRIAPGYPGAGEWTLPGGGLDWGEHPEAGMHRELYEEAGLAGEIRGLLGVDSIVVEPPGRDPIHSIRIVYEVTARGEPRVTEVDGSVDDSRWIPLDGIAGLPVVDLVEFALEAAGIG